MIVCYGEALITSKAEKHPVAILAVAIDRPAAIPPRSNPWQRGGCPCARMQATARQLCHADKQRSPAAHDRGEEGIARGWWLGGERAALLMQSSGVGNCVNALTLASNCGFPLLMLVTMRGETGERNPWQVPMGQATPEALRLTGVRTLRLERAEEASAVANTAAKVAFEEQSAVALLISQQLIGVKSFEEKR